MKAGVIVGEIGVYSNKCEYEKVELLLAELEQYISLDNPINRQYKERIETRIKAGNGKMSKEESGRCFRKILEATIPYEAVLKEGEKYLTNVEMQCLLNIAMCIGRENKELDVLMALCRQLKADEGVLEHIAAWETIMTNVANIYGNSGEYDKSDAINLDTMKECLHSYRMNLLDMQLYIYIWNHGERKKKNIPFEKGYQVDMYLKKCITICQINKDNAREIMVKEQLKKLLTN